MAGAKLAVAVRRDRPDVIRVAFHRRRVVRLEPQEIARREGVCIGGMNRDRRDDEEEKQDKAGVFHESPRSAKPQRFNPLVARELMNRTETIATAFGREAWTYTAASRSGTDRFRNDIAKLTRKGQ